MAEIVKIKYVVYLGGHFEIDWTKYAESLIFYRTFMLQNFTKIEKHLKKFFILQKCPN